VSIEIAEVVRVFTSDGSFLDVLSQANACELKA
jgi:hypothetical protein